MILTRRILSCFVAALILVGAAKESSAQKSSPEALNVYSDAASFQNNGAFDLAVDEWEKFLKKFPEDPLAPKAQHYLGVCNMALKPPKYDKAEAAFAAIVKNHPKFEEIEQAYFNLGWCQFSQAQAGKAALYDKAAKTFEALIKAHPDGKVLDKTLYYYGDSLYNQNKKKEAIAGYAQLVSNEKLAKSSLRKDAVYALGVTHEELGQYADAGKAYDIFLTEFADDAYATEVRMRKAETILQDGKYEQAGKIFGEAAASEGFNLVDHALFRQAFCVAKLDKFKEAGDIYGRVASEFKDSVNAKDAAIEAARCYYRGQVFDKASTWLQATLAAGGSGAPEAAHWLCKIHLKNGEPAKAEELATQTLPKAAESKFLVNLLMDQADAVFETPSKRGAAYDLFVKIASEHADHELAPQALYNAAFTALDQKKYDDATKNGAAFLEKYADHQLTADVKYVGAESNLQLAKHADAEAGFRDLVTKHTDHSHLEQWRVRLGLCLYLQKKYADTIEALQGVIGEIKAPDQLAEGQFLIGSSNFYQDKFAPAITAYNASLAANAKWRQADETMLFLSRAYRKQNKLDEAIAAVKKLIADFPQSGLLDRAHYRYGEYSYTKGDYPTAISEYNQVPTKWPQSIYAPYALYGKGWSELKKTDYANAEVSFTSLIGGHAGHQLIPDAQFARGMCNRRTSKLAEAIADFDAYLAANPAAAQKSTARYEKGLAEVALKKHDVATQTFAKLLADDPKYSAADKVLYELAWAYKLQNKNDDAVVHFTKLSTAHPKSSLAAEAHFHVGEVHYQKKQYEDALKQYTSSKEKAGKGDLEEKATYKLGWSFYQTDKFDSALKEFDQAVTEYPNGALKNDSLFMKAECQFKLKKFADALPSYKAAQVAIAKDEKISAEIKVLVALHGGQSASQQKKWDDALAMLSPIPEKHPTTAYLAEANYEIGWAQQNLNKNDEAWTSFEKAATKSRGVVGARARFMMGELKFTAKKFDEAIPEFQRCMFGYGGENALPEVKNWQAKSGYEAARCCEVQIEGATGAARAKLIADAKKFYGNVVKQHPKHEFAEQAQKRLTELNKL